MELVPGTVWATQTQSVELQDALEVREQHLDFLSLATRRDVGVSGGDVAGQVASPFMDRAGDLARRHVGRTAFPQAAAAAVLLSRAIADEAVLADIAPGGREVAVPGAKALAARADVAVVVMVAGEGIAFERAVAAGRLVEHRDVRLDVTLV